MDIGTRPADVSQSPLLCPSSPSQGTPRHRLTAYRPTTAYACARMHTRVPEATQGMQSRLLADRELKTVHPRPPGERARCAPSAGILPDAPPSSTWAVREDSCLDEGDSLDNPPCREAAEVESLIRAFASSVSLMISRAGFRGAVRARKCLDAEVREGGGSWQRCPGNPGPRAPVNRGATPPCQPGSDARDDAKSSAPLRSRMVKRL